MKTDNHLLLLDLDGVLVVENTNTAIHQGLNKLLCSTQIPYAVLSHRNTKEALQVVKHLNLQTDFFRGCFGAEQILKSAIRHGKIFTLLREGTKKSLILPFLNEKFHIPVNNMIFIDDRASNGKDMKSNGVGLVMVAPSDRTSLNGTTTSFDFEIVFHIINKWILQGEERRLVTLPAKQVKLSSEHHVALIKESRTFSMVRNIVRDIRTFVRN